MTEQGKKHIYSVSISGRIILNLHALNNEGSEGNILNTRQVYVVTGQGQKPMSTNAISGDMLKHIQADYFRGLAQHYGLALSEGAKLGNANRINWDFEHVPDQKIRSEEGNVQLLDRIITSCALTDAEGILVAIPNRHMHRKSLAEFGWTVGLPGVTRTESYLHTKYVADDSDQGEGKKSGEKSTDATNLGQNLFHRPASSGTYAFVCHIDLSRVGYNDIAQHYPEGLGEGERLRRGRALLESVLYTFLQLDGAHRNTQSPHVVDIEGVITTSKSIVPAPALSALKPEYQMHIDRIAKALNTLHPNAIEVSPFTDIGEFADEMSQLIATIEPYHLPEFGRVAAKQ